MGDLDSKEYAALIIAARRLGYSADDFEYAMARFIGNNGEDLASEQAKAMRSQIEQEAARVLAERSGVP